MFTMQKEIMESINNKISPKTKKICHSFKFAFSGMWFCIKNERNFRFHLFAALTVSLIAPYYKFITVEKILLVFVITTVLISEMFNTAIEAFIDAQTKKYITFAKVAKDVSAGAVLLAAICAIVCGLFLFLKVDIIHNILTDIFTSIPKIIATIIYFSAGYVFISKGGRNIS
jgi:diacylglycerol kinase